MSIKKQIVMHSIIGGFMLAVLIAGTFVDQKIAEYAYIGEGISVIGAVLGKTPAWILFLFASTVLYKGTINREKRDRARLPLILFYLTAIIGSAVMLGFAVVESVIDGGYKYLIAALIAGCAVMLAIMLSTKITPDIVAHLKKWCIMAGITIAIIFTITMVMKFAWSRARYIDIITGESAFTPWYKPNWFGGTGDSMPSGHTALAATLYLVPLMFKSLPKLAAYQTTATIVASLVVVFIVITRVIGGYHFISDVAMAGLISYATISIAGNIFFGKRLDNTTISERSWMTKF